MEGRKQFTFYRSYFDAVTRLSRKARRAVLEAVVSYGLDGTEPEDLTPVEAAVFILIKPTLDASRKKAGNGSVGGSKPKANRKQTKREIEKENEIENELEDESLQGQSVERAQFDSFWEAYPRRIGKPQAWEAWRALGVEDALYGRIMEGLEAWKGCKQWHNEGGRFIPYAARWLKERYFDAPPEAAPLTGAQGYLGQAELEAIKQVMGNGYADRYGGEAASQ